MSGNYEHPHVHHGQQTAHDLARVPLWVYVVRIGLVLALVASMYAAFAFRERAEFAESQVEGLVMEWDAGRGSK